MPTVIETADRFRTQLSRLETSATNDLLSAYRGVTNRLEDKITVLLSKFEQLEKQGQLTPENVRKLGTWASLLNQIEDEISKYGGYVDTQNRLAAQKSIDLAGKHSQLLTATYFNDNPNLLKAFNATWDKLPSDQVETLVGFLQQDSQLSINLNNSLGTNAANNFASKLIEGIALGYNPNKINQLINQTLSEPLTWSLNSVRTTQNYTYREATRANYLNNTEIIGSWKWYAALDGRVCLSCVNQHGREFPLNARLNDHHQGRCTQIPILDRPERFGLKTPKISLGEKWFNGLPETEQRQRMGNDRYAAYKAGKFKFNELSQEYQNDTFGTMLKEASLKTLLNKIKPPKVSIPKTVKEITKQIENLTVKAQDIFRVSKSLSSDTKTKINEGLDYINKVHGFDPATKKTYIDEITSATKGTLGIFYPSTRAIEVLDKHSDTVTTVIHEIGHFLDFELGNGRTATKSPALKEWRNAVENSKAYLGLIDRLANPDNYVLDTVAGKIKPDVAYTNYLTKLEEAFARSYAQYIVTKNGQNKLFNETRKDKLYGLQQWDTNDFKPIEKAFDQLFEDLKWQTKN